jgi:thiamine biosynthesis lipoprotein
MDTLVTLVVETAAPAGTAQAALGRAAAWFPVVEQACSRFDPASELLRLCTRPGEMVAVSPLLFEAIAFACAVARQTRGAFDPTIGHRQQARGFDQNYRSGIRLAAPVERSTSNPPDYRDVEIDSTTRTIRLRRPLLLDLGAVAKGLAIDLAARELRAFARFAVEAGGDLYAGGAGTPLPWQIGIRFPGEATDLLDIVPVWNAALCTSAGDARPAAALGEHHLLDPRRGHSPRGVLSASVIAPTAMVADALSTAAFVLGPARACRFLATQQVDYLLLSATGERLATPGFDR